MTRARDVANIDGLLTTTGDTYYASAAGTPARLGIGSTDQVLKVSGGVPTWATPSGGMSWVSVLARTSMGTGTSYTATGLSGYNQLMIFVEGLSNNGTTGKYTVTFNADTGSNYFFFGGGFSTNLPTSVGSGQRFFQSSATTSIDLCDMPAGSSLDIAAGIHILGANTTAIKTGYLQSGSEHSATTTTSVYTRNVNFRYNGTSVISSVTITASAGNFDAGFVTILGSVN